MFHQYIYIRNQICTAYAQSKVWIMCSDSIPTIQSICMYLLCIDSYKHLVYRDTRVYITLIYYCKSKN